MLGGGLPEKINFMKVKKIVKRIFLVLGVFVLLLVGAMLAIPFFFKDDLLRVVKEQANAGMRATLDFEDANLSFFRQFPLLTLSLENYSLKGLSPFEGVELAGGERIDLSFRIGELFGESIPLIRALHLEKPRLHILVLQDGTANYDIAKEYEDSSREEVSYAGDQELLRLKKFSMNGGEIVYDDRLMDFFLQFDNLKLQGSGRFAASIYDLDLQALADALTLSYGGMTYLNRIGTKLDAGLQIDLEKMRFDLRDNQLLLNELPLQAEGYLALPEDAIEMDLKFSSPGSSFKQLFSIMPHAYTPAYADAEITGAFQFQGVLKGRMTEEEYPAMDIGLKVKNGRVQYPDLPMGLRDIRAEASLQSPQGDLDGLVFDMPILHFKLGENPFSARLHLQNPISDPDLDMRVKGVVDLADLAKAYPMEGVQTLAGRLQADMQARARMSQIEQEKYEKVKMSGTMALRDLRYEAEGQPPLHAKKIALNFSPQYVELEEAVLRMGKSDLTASGRIDNLPALFSSSNTLRGSLTLRSNQLLLDEWMEESAVEPNASAPVATTTEEEDQSIPPFDFALDASCNKLVYDAYVLENVVCKGEGSLDELKVEELSFVMGESDFRFTGAFRQIDEYLFKEGVLQGEVALRSHKLDLNPFMEEESSSAGSTSDETVYEPIEVPRNLQLSILADVDKLLYTDIELYDLQARLLIQGGQAILEKCRTKTLGGSVALAGSYDSSVDGDPLFSFKYDLSNMDFQKSYKAFNTFQALAPMAKYLKGKFNSSLILEGSLGPDLMPKYDLISADGFLETIQGKIEGMPALAAVDRQLGVPLLAGMELKDTRNWFEVREGRVEVKPFDYRWQDIAMNISGSHGLNGDMDYYIVADVPREKLGRFADAALEKGLAALQKQAGALGLSLDKAEVVKLGISLKGSLEKPKVGVKLLGTDGQQTVQQVAKEELQQTLATEKEKLKNQAEDKVSEAKGKAKEELNKAAAQAEEAVKEQIEKGVSEAKEKAGETLGEQAGELGKKAEEALGEQGKKAKEEIEQQLENFNPFKKKKDKKKKKGGN